MADQKIVVAFRELADVCLRLGSPLYHGLLQRIVDDLEGAGVCWRVLEPGESAPPGPQVPLRFLATVHRMALEGGLPGVARAYPSCGGDGDPEVAWAALSSALTRDPLGIVGRMYPTVQTNEVARSCALLPGFAAVARRTSLPFRLLEIGCSAGLNLRWDRFRYEGTAGAWGPGSSPVVFRDAFAGGVVPDLGSIEIVERRGCDLNPIELTPEGRLTLLSFVWPDQRERFEQLARAMDVATDVPATLDRADAVEWTERQLSKPGRGVVTVLFHSIVWLYLSSDAQQRLTTTLETAGAAATPAAPIAWLRMEPGARDADVDLTLWPGPEHLRVARAAFHGRHVEMAAGV